MTEDQPDRTDRVELDDVRRLLAEARHTEPMPNDVVARMEATLAELAREPRAVPATPVGSSEVSRRSSEVIPIEAHRRRRAGGLLLAAAAVVVGGAVVVPHLHLSSNNNSTAATAGSAADSSSGRFSAGAKSSARALPSQPAPGPENGAVPQPITREGRVVVRPGHFSADALAAESLLTVTTQSTQTKHDSLRLADLSSCVSVPRGARLLPATYQRAPAALVFRRPRGSTQVVDLVLCGQSGPTRSVTLSLP